MTDERSPAETIVPDTVTDPVTYEREYGAVMARVAAADLAVQTLDAAIQALRNQRKVANAALTLRLREHTEFLMAHGTELRARHEIRLAAAASEPRP